MKFVTATVCVLLASLQLANAVPAPLTAESEAAAAAAISVSVSYDPKYDVEKSSLNTVACSDGVNGLISKGYTTFGSLPKFPFIGGAPTVGGWNSPNCGKCYQLHYKGGNVDKTINVLAIDAAPGGFNIGLDSMNCLTNGQAVNLGRVTATYTPVADKVCGL